MCLTFKPAPAAEVESTMADKSPAFPGKASKKIQKHRREREKHYIFPSHLGLIRCQEEEEECYAADRSARACTVNQMPEPLQGQESTRHAGMCMALGATRSEASVIVTWPLLDVLPYALLEHPSWPQTV